jgi:hypothetical protein
VSVSQGPVKPLNRAIPGDGLIAAFMKSTRRSGALMACCCAALLASAGCASTGNQGASSSQAFAPLPPAGVPATSVANVAGRYHGKFLLKTKPVGDAYFNLTQSGTAIGGTLKLVLSKRTLYEPVAMTLDVANDSFTGSATDPTGKTPCTYALRGSYNPKTFILRGTSSPATCSGKVANFAAAESCFYVTGSGIIARRSEARGIIECSHS